MNSSRNRIVVAACAAAALAIPVAAQAKPGHGHGRAPSPGAPHQGHSSHQPVRGANVIAAGTVTSVDGSVVTFTVERGNHAGRAFRGQQLQADVSSARIRVRDVNGDGSRDVSDVAVGDRVQAQLRIPRGTTDLSQPFAARRLLDWGPPAPAGSTDPAGTDPTDGSTDPTDGSGTPTDGSGSQLG